MKRLLHICFALSTLEAHSEPEAIEVVLPAELTKSADISVSLVGSTKDNSIKLKTKGVWIIDAAKLEKITPKVAWIIFDFGGKRMRQVLQVENGRAVIFSETLTLRYKFTVPLKILLRNELKSEK